MSLAKLRDLSMEYREDQFQVCLLPMSFKRLVAKPDVVGLSIEIVNPVKSQVGQQLSHNRPAIIEQLLRRGLPFCQHFTGEIGWVVDIRFGEIQNAWRKNKRHLDRQKIGIVVEQLGHGWKSLRNQLERKR